ncbi:hypothetical protein [Cellvibrio sp. UBA7671]|uniref:hypothetical protein n=1 Tax=Cellvibrio sp. UBA7671 TaxID=1946312 RepID=UPI002F35CF19
MKIHTPSSNAAVGIDDNHLKLREELRREFEFHVTRLEDKITAKNSNISELAMSKVLRVVGLLGTALIGVFGVLAYFGFDELRTTLVDYSSKKVDRWMSYEEVETPIMKSLTDIKDQYLIDSLYIRLQRAKAEGHRSSDYSLTNKERADLIRIANSPDTSSSDYSTVLTLLYAPYQLGLGKFSFDKGGSALAKIFTEDGFIDQLEKQRELLRTFSHDTSLAHIAGGILASENHPLKDEAFQLLANIGAPIAVMYANENITPEHIDEIDHQMALVLAARDIDSEMLKRYITFLRGNPGSHDHWLYHMFDLFEHLHSSTNIMFETYESKKLAEKQHPMAIDILAYLIEAGHGFDVSDAFDLQLRFGKGQSSLLAPERYEFESLLKDNEFLNKLIVKKDDVDWLSRVVKAFDIRHNEKVFVSVNVELLNNATLMLDGGTIVGKDDVLGDVWLTPSTESPGLSAVFRDKAGTIQRRHLKKVDHINNAKFSFKYLQKDLYLIVQNRDDFF